MYINGQDESLIKGRLYTEFKDIELERLKRDEPGKYQTIMKSPQEYEHERWVYIGTKYSEIRNDPKKKDKYLNES